MAELKYLSKSEVKTLDMAWTLATKVRSAEIITSGRSSDVLPRSARDMEAVGRWCGYEPNQGYQLEDDYLKATRRARAIFEKRFYGFED